VSALLCLLVASGMGQAAGERMPLDNAVVHRPTHITKRKVLAGLPEGLVVVTSPAEDVVALAKQFRKAAAAEHPVVREGVTLCILAAGPMLDGPDKVQPGKLVRRGSRIELEILHTAVRLRGAQLRRNIIWRPLVQVTLELPAGRYQVEATWLAVAALPDGKRLEAPPRVNSTRFAVLPQK